MTDDEPDVRERPATLDMLDDLRFDVYDAWDNLSNLFYRAELHWDEGTLTDDYIETRMRPILDELVDAVRRAGVTGVRG